MGGSGGHSDTAAGAKMSMIVAPLSRARLPIVVDNVLCKSTPGNTVDVLVTQRGIAVNPLRPELADAFKGAGLPVYDIMDLRDMAEKLNGKPHKPVLGDKEVAKVIYRDGTHLDTIYNVPVK
jgi:citrate lyase subunit alpha/citrate CoA-transferase